MKNRLFTGILFILLGILIAFGPIWVFPVCGFGGQEQDPAQSTSPAHNPVSTPMGEQSTMSSDSTDAKDSMQMSSGMVMKCRRTFRAELGLGALIALLGALLFIFKAAPVRLGLSMVLGLSGILVILIPTVLIGVCRSVHMTCHSLTLPALIILGGATTVSAAVNAVYLFIKQSKKAKAS